METIDFENFEITARDGLKINACHWIPKESKAIMCIVHGIGEHSGRYNGLANYLCSQDIAVFSYDQRGHGKSEGKRGHSSSYGLLLDDVENIMKHARSQFPDLALFLFGHSWGGNIVSNFILKKTTKEISGAILSAPWLELKLNLSPLLLGVAILTNKVFPSLTQPNQLNPAWLSKDQEVVKSYIEDPLVHSRISVATYLQALVQGKWAIKNAMKLKTPTLVMHGTDDMITSYEGSVKFTEIASKLASFKAWKKVKHEPHNDLEKDEVYTYLSTWIYRNIPVSQFQ